MSKNVEKMTPAEFEVAKEPYTFFCSINPITGAVNYEYLEGEDWRTYIESIKDDFPERHHFAIRNAKARELAIERILGVSHE